MSLPTLHTRHSILAKAVADAKTLSVRAVLSYPGRDLVGDIVHFDKFTWQAHQRDPWIDLEHAGAAVGWARDTLSKSGGKYALDWSNQTIDGQTHRLPVGTTYFDASDRLSAQVFALVERDALPGVSLEFRPDWTVAKSLGRSPVEPRNAYEFLNGDVVRWTHCAHPVCPGALTVTKSLEPLLKVLTDKRLGTEALHPTIYKSLAPYLSTRTRSVAMNKALPDEEQTVYDDAAPGDAAAPDAAGAPGDDAPALGGVAAKYQFAQSILDACAEYESAMQSSDSPELRKIAEKFTAMANDLAGKVKGAADKHDAKLNGSDDPDDDPDADPDAAGGEGSDEPDMSEDEDDTLKAMRPCYYAILKARPRRFSAAEIQWGIDPPLTASPPKPERTEDDDPEDLQALTRAARRFRKLQSIYGD